MGKVPGIKTYEQTIIKQRAKYYESEKHEVLRRDKEEVVDPSENSEISSSRLETPRMAKRQPSEGRGYRIGVMQCWPCGCHKGGVRSRNEGGKFS
jgi:hypothetical protein